ncbi:MAG: metallophosphoesterase [Weeksellaceae bacterium]|nr:metallophosphoesterase [Weeksellaceae bacterium]
MYDFIGDIHGHADELQKLLVKLDYQKTNGVYAHPTRKVFFLGDFIDRGPQIKETLQIAKAMVDAGNAVAIMGNHEYNAICFHLEESQGGHLRKHSIKNILQHADTLKQFQNDQEEYDQYVKWFKSLPIFWEEPTFRAAHACWDESNIAFLKNNIKQGILDDTLLKQSVKKETPLHHAVEETLKGKELALPKQITFSDKDGNIRKEIRVRWWLNPAETSLHAYSVHDFEGLPKEPVSLKSGYYSETDKPVFFGHYWLQGIPELIRNNVCCLDFSVAKGGKLVAYRFDGENHLQPSKLVFV